MRRLKDASVRLFYPVSNQREVGNKQYARLEIDDETSGLTVLTVELEPGQLFKMMAGGEAKGTVELTEHPNHLNKEEVVMEIEIPESYNLRPVSTVSTPGVKRAMEVAYADGWDHVAYRRRNSKHLLVVRKWVTPEKES